MEQPQEGPLWATTPVVDIKLSYLDLSVLAVGMELIRSAETSERFQQQARQLGKRLSDAIKESGVAGPTLHMD